MNVRLELEFQSIAELKEYLDKTIGTVFPNKHWQEMALSEPVAPTAFEPASPVPQAEPEPEAPPQAPEPEPEQLVPDAEPQTPTPEEAPAQTVSAAATSYTLDDLARAGSELVDMGRQMELPALLQQFGANSLPEVPVDRYGEFATKLREMGARI